MDENNLPRARVFALGMIAACLLIMFLTRIADTEWQVFSLNRRVDALEKAASKRESD